MQLDARQRAMLLEMGVRVWLPPGAAESSARQDPAPSVEPASSTELPAHESAQSAAATTATQHEAQAPNSAEGKAAGTLSPTARPSVPHEAVAAPADAAASGPSAAPAATPASPATRAAPAALLPASERTAAIAQMDWPALQQAVSGCRACRLCETRQHTVFGVGQPQAPVDWLIIGEAPGEREDNLGEPFVGPAGQLLDAMLQAIGLTRADTGAQDPKRAGQQTVFISNVLKCRPPGNRNPQADEIAQCLPYLERQIALLQPRLILALGRFAAQALLAPSMPEAMTLPLGKLRGRPYTYGPVGIPVVVSYHPAYLLRNLPDKAKSWADLVLATQVLREAPRRSPSSNA